MPDDRDPLATLKTLNVTPDSGPSVAAETDPSGPMKANAHIHLPPNFSAFKTVSHAVDLAAAADLRVLGASNYYHYGVYAPFAELASKRGIFPLFGLEVICLIDELVAAGVKINDPGNPGKMYLCGKGITRFAPMDATAQRLVETIRANDSTRIAAMIARLAALFQSRGLATGVTEASAKAMIVRRHGVAPDTVYLQERHVAQAFQEALFAGVPASERHSTLSRVLEVASKAAPDDAVAVQNEIRSHLMKAGKPGYLAETFTGFAHVYDLVLALGGIPCYPTLADGALPICSFEDPVEKLIASLQEHRIWCAELIPNRNKPEVLERYALAMRSAGIVMLGGTEHNTLDLIPMEPECVAGAPLPERVKQLFWEGACVVAAHQYLTARGQAGFVGPDGTPNAAYKTAEERIAAFSRLGSTVVDAYRRSAGTAA
jgi:hypothetical protein